MKKNHLKMVGSIVIMALLLLGCENNLEILLPQGPKGEQGEKGDKGDPGMSAFELWLEVNGKEPGTPIEDFFNSLKGKDGVDGAVPIIGENGNWFIDGVDTGIPARGRDGIDGVTPLIGENGNWYIGDVDTGVPARGVDGADGISGVDGKSAYELWKEAVDRDEMTNKDGSDYTGGNTWEDFLIWLQGGDVSVLHRYWITLPGNEGKSIEEFIDELFDCHCDGITVSVFYNDECMGQNTDGTLNETYNAQLRVGGPGGTQVQVTGEGIDFTATIVDDTTPALFTIPRGEENIPVSIACTQSGNTVMKHAVIPALQLVKLADPPTAVQVPGEQEDVVSVSFETAPRELLVDGVVVYDADGIVEGSGWVVSNEGRTFTRTYERTAVEQKPMVRAFNSNGICTTIEEAFTIPPLTPVEVGELILEIIDDCFLSITFSGTPGMTVKAMNAANHDLFVMLTEDPAGTYVTSEIPRRYEAFTVLVRAEMEGRGTVEKTIEVDGVNLSPVAEPLTISLIPGVDDGTSHALVQRRFTNNTNAPLTVTATRGNNSYPSALAHPLALGFPRTAVIPPHGFIDGEFYRDYTPTLADGYYVLTFHTLTECELDRSYTLTIDNQQNYRHAFGLIDGWGDGSGDPNDLVTIEVSIFDAIPESYVEFQLFNGTAYSGVSRIQLDDSGHRTWNITGTRAQVQTALDNQKGFFYFFSDSEYTTKYSIGAHREEVLFEFD